MRIVIVGAGAVGSYLAERLAIEGQDVVVVESNPVRAAEVQSEVDCLVVPGNGASPATLEEAGLEQADLLIAVTSADAVNVLACHAAARLGVPRKVARVEDPLLRDEVELLGVDFLIDPGESLARELRMLMRQGGVSELIEFANGRLVLMGGHIREDAPATNMTLADIRADSQELNWIVVAVIRHGETIIARGSTRIEADDHVLFMVREGQGQEALDLLGLEEHPAKKVLVLGATRLAVLTAQLLADSGVQSILIDQDHDRCRSIAERHPKVVCVNGDPTDPKVLQSEGVEKADAVLALTGWDEVNILASLIAKSLGVPMTVARFHRFDLVRLLAGHGIDVGVSSRLAAANDILRFVRRGRIHSVATFQDSDAEAIELQVGLDSPALGKTLGELHLPHSMIVGGVLRANEAFVPLGDTSIQPGDRLIVIALPEAIPEVEQLSGR